MSKLFRVDDDTALAIPELAGHFHTDMITAIRYAILDALERARNPRPGDVIGNLVKINEPFEPMEFGGDYRGPR